MKSTDTTLHRAPYNGDANDVVSSRERERDAEPFCFYLILFVQKGQRQKTRPYRKESFLEIAKRQDLTSDECAPTHPFADVWTVGGGACLVMDYCYRRERQIQSINISHHSWLHRASSRQFHVLFCAYSTRISSQKERANAPWSREDHLVEHIHI